MFYGNQFASTFHCLQMTLMTFAKFMICLLCLENERSIPELYFTVESQNEDGIAILVKTK